MLLKLIVSALAGALGWWAFGGPEGLFVVPIVFLFSLMLRTSGANSARSNRSVDDGASAGLWGLLAGFFAVGHNQPREDDHSGSYDGGSDSGDLGGGDFGGGGD